MKKFYFFSMFVMMFSVITCISSCSEDDGSDVSEGLVSETLPTKKGWDGSMENGVCTYTPDYGDDDADGYYAFSFKDGKCDEAVYNMIFETEAEAKEAANLLNNGSFDDLEALDEEEYSYSDLAVAKALNQVNIIRKAILNKQIASRADLIGISCTQEGKVVFFKIECLKGKDGETVKMVVDSWETGLDNDVLPEEPIFGTYDSVSGKYTLNNIMGLKNSKYEITVGFESDKVSSFVTAVTLPNVSWAEYLEEDLNAQAEDYYEMFGAAPTVKREGSKITIEAVILDTNVSKSDILKYIVVIDFMLNIPAGLMF